MDRTAAEKLDMSLDDILKTSRAKPQGAPMRRGKARSGGAPYTKGTDADGNRVRAPRHGVRVYVSNLPWNITWQNLKDFMKEAGEVLHANILTGPDGKSKGCGVVEFADQEGADAAIGTLDGRELLGRPLHIREDREPRGFGEAQMAEKKQSNFHESTMPAVAFRASKAPETQVYIGNLPFRTSWQDLKDLCSQFGSVLRADVATDPKGLSKGFGTVVFETEEAAQHCINTLDNSDYQGRTLSARYDEKTPAAIPAGCKLYVGNLSFRTSWQDLKDLFSQYGAVTRADVARSPQGESKGFGVVVFQQAEDADTAIAQLHDTEFQGRRIIVRLDRQLPTS